MCSPTPSGGLQDHPQERKHAPEEIVHMLQRSQPFLIRLGVPDAKVVPDSCQRERFFTENPPESRPRNCDTIEQGVRLLALVRTGLQRLQPLEGVPELLDRIPAVVSLGDAIRQRAVSSNRSVSSSPVLKTVDRSAFANGSGNSLAASPSGVSS